jgi:hypothetical protein
LPLTGNSFEFVSTTIVEVDPRTRNKVSDGPRDKYLRWRGEGHHASTDVDRDPADICSPHLDLSGMKACTNLKSD